MKIKILFLAMLAAVLGLAGCHSDDMDHDRGSMHHRSMEDMSRTNMNH